MIFRPSLAVLCAAPPLVGEVAGAERRATAAKTNPSK